jgi:subtilisin family serine protease
MLRASAATGFAVLALLGSSAADHSTADGGRFAVGYTTHRALALAVHRSNATVLRTLVPLRVAEIRGGDIAALRHAPGIRFVQRVAPRGAAAEPALGSTPVQTPEWQFHATRSDLVPDSVLRAAAAITIGVIDTGADVAAPDLAAKTPGTWNTRTGAPDIRDTNGHGTFVASLAGGSITNGDGIAGAGGDAQLLLVKSGSDGGSFTDLDEAAGIMYAVDHGARILNLSVGGTTTSVTERRAVQYAIDHGALVVTAVGNDFDGGNPVEYPAALVQPVGSNGAGGAGLAVTASTPDGKRALFANTGSWVSLAAPGEHVFGAVSATSPPAAYPRTPLAGSRAGLYGYASGTSFAAPQIAGAAALVWAANPSLTAQQVAQILKETASGRGTWTPELGFGIVDVAAAVARAQDGRAGVLLGGLRDKSRIRLAWSGDAATFTLTQSVDGGAAKTLLRATTRTSLSVALTKGRRARFTLTGLDANGAVVATSSLQTR